MTDEDNNSNTTPVNPVLPDLHDMGNIPAKQADPHPPIIIPKEIENNEDLYEDVHDQRRRAVIKDKLTGVALLFFIGMVILLLALVNGFKKAPGINPGPARLPGDPNKPIESYYPAHPVNRRPADPVPTAIDTTNPSSVPADTSLTPSGSNTIDEQINLPNSGNDVQEGNEIIPAPRPVEN